MELKHWHILDAIVILVLGTILHFTWEWFGYNPAAAIFNPVNESTWEHLKLLFMPMLLMTAIEYFIYGKLLKNFIPVRFWSIVFGMAAIVIIFYTYTGIAGDNYLWADILTFFIGTIITCWFSFCILQTEYFTSPKSIACGFIGFFLLSAAFIWFTFRPLPIGLFQSPSFISALSEYRSVP